MKKTRKKTKKSMVHSPMLLNEVSKKRLLSTKEKKIKSNLKLLKKSTKRNGRDHAQASIR